MPGVNVAVAVSHFFAQYWMPLSAGGGEKEREPSCCVWWRTDQNVLWSKSGRKCLTMTELLQWQTVILSPFEGATPHGNTPCCWETVQPGLLTVKYNSGFPTVQYMPLLFKIILYSRIPLVSMKMSPLRDEERFILSNLILFYPKIHKNKETCLLSKFSKHLCLDDRELRCWSFLGLHCSR